MGRDIPSMHLYKECAVVGKNKNKNLYRKVLSTFDEDVMVLRRAYCVSHKDRDTDLYSRARGL